MDAPDYEEQHAVLMAERSRLRDLDTIPDRWEPRPTGETWGGVWDALSPSQRGPWLARKGFRVTATREAVSVAHGGVVITVPIG